MIVRSRVFWCLLAVAACRPNAGKPTAGTDAAPPSVPDARPPPAPGADAAPELHGSHFGVHPPERSDPMTGDHRVSRAREAMGTIISLSAWGEDDEQIVRAFEEVFAEFKRIDALMTTWTDDSEVSKINAAAGDGKGVPVSKELIDLLLAARRFSELSDGAFDVTIGSFAGVWKFDEDVDGSIPEDALVEERRKLVAYRDLVIDRGRRTARLKRAGQKITLGGIAKGYAVDRGVAILHARGLVDFIVQAGGDMYVAGQRGDRKWRVGIRDPRGARDDFFAMAEVADMTFSTSGDYERFVLKDGKRYHHIIDPRTGRPATASRSVTVMARDALTADGLSKSLFILGPEKGMALLKKLPGVEAVWVDAENKVHTTPGLADRVKILKRPTPGP
jgi:thiamine biosynthesis lipoprotein